MRAIILLNGEPYDGEIVTNGAYVYCCDGAYEWAKNKVKIDENLGDFDSLNYVPNPPPSEVYPSEKDETDGEIALNRAIRSGAEYITFYGSGGGREDHFIGNLHLLYAAMQCGIEAEAITNYARIFVAKGHISLDRVKGKTISILPFGCDAHIIESAGLKYPLFDLTLRYGITRGISNVATENTAYIVSESAVLILVNHK